jgi:hypothetical protein
LLIALKLGFEAQLFEHGTDTDEDHKDGEG